MLSSAMMNAFRRISVEVQAPTARLSLAHPPLNIIDIPMMEELSAVLAEIDSRSDVSVLVVAGSEKAFSAGVDVAAHTPEKIEEMLTKFHAVFKTLVASRKVSIGAVRGHCLGGGAELAMVCDLVVSAENATWGFPEISLGCFPPVAATALASLVGQKRAAELILTGRTFDGREATNFGLANYVARQSQVLGKVGDLVEQLVKLSPAALGMAKKAMYAWDSMHFDKGLARAEKIYLEELMKTDDAREGIAAFLEKRAAVWKGKR
jgi:cyclohexa-1,5-dienecarbonyl-CoA hydratase